MRRQAEGLTHNPLLQVDEDADGSISYAEFVPLCTSVIQEVRFVFLLVKSWILRPSPGAHSS